MLNNAITIATWIAISLSFCNASSGHLVEAAYDLEKLNAAADIIVKVVVEDSRPLDDEWFEKAGGFQAITTKMKIVSVIKGDVDSDQMEFQHYTPNPDDQLFRGPPQNYTFENGRAYIVLAKKTDKKNTFRQIWRSHKSKEDQGVLLASSDRRTIGATIKDVYWSELTGFLQLANTGEQFDDVVYAINQMDLMSGGDRYMGVEHFDRVRVLKQVLPFVQSKNQSIMLAAVTLLASGNPYMETGKNPFWLAAIGQGHVPGIGAFEKDYVNVGATLYWKELVSIANTTKNLDVKVAAIRSLGTTARPEVWEDLKTWLHDDNDRVRQAAVVLLADYKTSESERLVAQAASDPEPQIRQAAARAIGYGQFKNKLAVLELLLKDKDTEVVASAALSLVSFSINDNRDILLRQMNHTSYRSIFVNVLAIEKPGKYLNELGQLIRKDSIPSNWWGGQIPWGQAWDTLFNYANSRATFELQSGNFDRVLDSLESPVSEQMETARYFSSQQPRDLYQLYVKNGLTRRAVKFRKICNERIPFDIETYFKQVDRQSK